MANETTTSTLNDLIPSIIAEALFVAQERSIMRGLVRNYTLPFGNGKTVTVPRFPLVTASGVSEGTDLSNTAVSTDSAILTVSEVGIMTTVTDMALRAAQGNVIADVGRLFGDAIARKMDRDLTALFAGFSAVEGAGSAAITAADIFKAVAKLRNAGVPATDLYAVVNPLIAYDLKANLTNTYANPNAGLIQNEALATGYVGMLAGVPVFESANVTETDGDSIGAVFHKDALGLALMQDIQIETERDASLRATELVATAVYGVGELYDGYGIGLNFDSSLKNPA
jgi:N4-gp56 family major capsid protein